MPEKSKMLCSACGQEMNQHAEKLIYTAGSLEPEAAADPVLGGVFYEVHKCLACGETATRKAS